MSPRAIVWAVTACCATAAALHAGQQTTFRSRLELVRVDVLVTDRGQPVTNLTKADFQIADNGVPQNVDVFGSEGTNINLVLVLDTSGSVSGDRLDRLRRASRSAIAALKDGDRVAVLGFNQTVGRGIALTTDLKDAVDTLNRAPVGGETSLYDASYAGMMLAESQSGRALQIVLSDGLDTTSWLTPEQVIDAVHRSSVVVYGVSINEAAPNLSGARPEDVATAKVFAELSYGASVSAAGPQFLRDVTTASGGRLFEIEASRNLDAVFTSTIAEFRSRYLVGYVPTGVDASGWHTIGVHLANHPNLTIHARPGYEGS